MSNVTGHASDPAADRGDAAPELNEAPLETIPVQVQLAASLNSWSVEKTEVQVVPAINGALQRCFDQKVFAYDARDELVIHCGSKRECLGTYAGKLSMCANKGFPRLLTAIKRSLRYGFACLGLASGAAVGTHSS